MPTFRPPHSPGLNLYYEVQGSGRETVLLLNGIMMSTRTWGVLLPSLTANYRVVLHDFRGQLGSDQPDEIYTYDQHVADLLALLDHLEIKKAHLVGTSYGSEIGMDFAARHPERVASLTIAGGSSHVDELLRAKVRAWILATELAIRHGERKAFYLITMPFNFSAQYIRGREAHFEKIAELVSHFPDTWFPAFKRLCECFLTLDLTAKLPRISSPTLVVAGTQDDLKPLHYSRLIAERIPDSRLIEIDAGHAFVIERPTEFAGHVLRFLADHPLQESMPGRSRQ